MKNMFILVSFSLFMSGCAQQSLVISDSKSEIKEKYTQHFFLNGLAQEKEINAAEVCGGVENVVRVEVQETFLNGLANVATLGIYTPREARVYCKQ
ncbi:MAG: lipoprotein bor [Gammaproteobacteria bacterium]|nr:lipoprotein bor [Gammaproteobacteria bacterium]